MRVLGFALYQRRARKSSAPDFKPQGKPPVNFSVQARPSARPTGTTPEMSETSTEQNQNLPLQLPNPSDPNVDVVPAFFPIRPRPPPIDTSRAAASPSNSERRYRGAAARYESPQRITLVRKKIKPDSAPLRKESSRPTYSQFAGGKVPPNFPITPSPQKKQTNNRRRGSSFGNSGDPFAGVSRTRGTQITPGVHAQDLVNEMINVASGMQTPSTPSTPSSMRYQRLPDPKGISKTPKHSAGSSSSDSPVQRRASLPNPKVQKTYEKAQRQILGDTFESTPRSDEPVAMDYFKKNRVGVSYYLPYSHRELRIPKMQLPPGSTDPTVNEKLSPLQRGFTWNKDVKKFRPNKVLGRVIEMRYPIKPTDNQLREFYTELTEKNLKQVRKHFAKLRTEPYDKYESYYIQPPRTFEPINPNVFAYVPYHLMLDALTQRHVFRAIWGYKEFFMAADRLSFLYFQKLGQDDVLGFLKHFKSEMKGVIASYPNAEKTVDETLEWISNHLTQLKAEIIKQFVYLYPIIDKISKEYEILIARTFEYVLKALSRESVPFPRLNAYQIKGLEVTAKEVFGMSWTQFRSAITTMADSPGSAQQIIELDLDKAYYFSEKEDIVRRALQLVNNKALSLLIMSLVY